MELKVYKDGNEVASAFADYLVESIKKKNDKFFIALSGGSTPKLLFALLAEEAYKNKIDWSKVHLFWGDERCVPPDHADSNYKMTYEQLISKINIPAGNIHRVLGENDPQEEAKRYSKEIDTLLPKENHLPVFDLVMLGMGDDGHTLSVFPHEIGLLKSDKICEVATHPTSGQKRVTLTGKIANNATVAAFLVTGSNKAEKVLEIFKKENNWNSYPAAHIHPSHGKLYWFMDKDAAALL
ncbi:MAG TPA: 6-phosphogluconolactonase [Cytophagaceae bacterium]|nr:6-phosphogluconolactonase [Cytophagaceae bacterium]